MTICLITPPSCFLLDERVFLSLGILKIAAVLEQHGHVVEVVDCSGISGYEDAIRDHATRTEAKIFGITATTPQMPAVARIVRELRATRPDAKLILGGPHVTLVCAALKREKKIGCEGRATRAYAKLEAMFDVLVAGDGEDSIFLAIKDDAPSFINADNPAVDLFLTSERLNELPWPARHLVDVESYRYTIEGHKSISIVAQLGCPFSSLTGDTLIFTERGFERMDSLVAGLGRSETCVHGATITVHALERTVTTHKGSASAVSVIDEGHRHVMRIQTENGIRTHCTPEHPFFVLVNGVPEWIQAKELSVGDWMILKTPEHNWPVEPIRLTDPPLPKIPPGGFQRKCITTPKVLDVDVAWFIGFLIGDGCLPRDRRPEVHVCVTPQVEDTLKELTQRLFGVPLTIYKSSVTSKMQHGWIRSRAAYNFFVHSIGIDPSNKHRVPEVIRCSPRPVVEAFVRGLMDADGYMEARGTSYLVTASEQLANDVAALLLLLGEVPSIQRIAGRGYRKPNASFRVTTFRNDRIPTAMAVYQSSKSGKWFWRTPRGRKFFLGIRRRTLTASGLKHPLDRPGWHYVRVDEIVKDAGLQRVYDLHVPEDHSFVANGLIAHNCGFCGGRESPMLRRIRTRTTDNIVREIVHLHETYGVTGIQFFDDELNVNQSMVELMNAIWDAQQKLGVEFRLRGFIKSQLFTDAQAEAMYRAGFRWILVGFESGSERILENINKKANRSENTRCMDIAKRHGLKVKALMSMGHPGESEQTVQDSKDWLLEVKPDDFDITVITTYPGTAYFDWAVQTQPDVWTYTYQKTGDRLHAYELDFTQEAGYYKGIPGEYKSYVFTDYLSADDLVRLRDDLEADIRGRLHIPFNQSAAAIRYEHSMGQPGRLPDFILRSTLVEAKSKCV